MPISNNDQDDIINQINITPLVDIVLVVLLVFIVTNSMIIRSSLEISLPKASTGEVVKQELINITISVDNLIYIDGKPSQLKEISNFLSNKKSNMNSDNFKLISVLISADSKIEYGVLVRIIDKIRENGISSIALDVYPLKG